MKTFLISVISTLFILSGCYNEITTPSVSSGKLILKIDRLNAPSDVVFVKAYLAHENLPPIIGSLNLISDSTAEILLDEINAGEWHLKVDAENDSGIVLYTGETDVEVFAGFTSQVYLTLQPTGAGVGAIYIHVTWGVPINHNWIDYFNNPIISKSNNYYDHYGVAQPVVLLDEGVYKMWYVGLDYEGSGSGNILYAYSNDGLNWVHYNNNPVIVPGNYYSWDSQNVQPGAIIKENGVYKMYYSGFSDVGSNWYIGLATSTDGLNWQKYPNAILSPTSYWEYQMVASSIIKRNNTYFLYYTGRNMPYYAVGVATSTDGINFQKYSGNPVLTNSNNWELTGVLDANVIEDNTQLKMVYMNSNGTGFGIATSSDGYNWIKSANNPFVTNQNTSNNWASGKIAYPYWLKLNNETRIYYSGTTQYSDEHRIGFMRKNGN